MAEGVTGEGAAAGGAGDAVDHGLLHHLHHVQGEEAPLVHLAPILAELADSVSDLTSNLDQLELVHARLDGFNDALAAWLLGLRANGYTVDFVEAPTRINFELSRQRQQERAILEEEERVKALLSMQQQQQHNVGSSEDEDDPMGSDARNRYAGADNTFVSSGGGADASFVSNQGFNDHHAPPPATRGGRGRGGSTGLRGGRGAGGRGGARGGAMAAAGAAAARKRKEEMAVSFLVSCPSVAPCRRETDSYSLRERGSSSSSCFSRARLLPIRSCPSSRSIFAKNAEPRRKRFSGPYENDQTVPPVSSLSRMSVALPSLSRFC